jgi:hypothetical protein
MTTPLTDPLAAAFDRARAAVDAVDVVGAPPVSAVRRRGTRLRRRRQSAAAGAAAVLLVAVVGATSMLRSHDTGLPAGPSVSPAPTVPGRSADGLLLPSDLGSGAWTADGAPGGDPLTSITVDGCGNGAAAFAPNMTRVAGRSRLFRGSTPEGAEWLLTEQVGTIVPGDRPNLLAQLRAIRNCRNASFQVVLAEDETVVVWGTPLTTGAVGAIGTASAFALVGDTLVSLDAAPGGSRGGPALPGQTRWLLDTLSAAVDRATGSVPALPEPNAAAARAAARYRLLDPAQVVRAPSADARATADDDTVPPGFITPADLGPTGNWSQVLVPGNDGTPLQAQLPGCASGAEVLVYGRGAAQSYVGRMPGGGAGGSAGATLAVCGMSALLETNDIFSPPTVSVSSS